MQTTTGSNRPSLTAQAGGDEMLLAMAPNIPMPVNGMVPQYDTSHRTFSRPFSAKQVFFYKEGDNNFQGVRIPVTKARYRTMDSLYDDLSDRVPLVFGVRKIFTPMGRREVDSIDNLQHMGRYVCSSNRWARQVNMKAIDRLYYQWKHREKQKSESDLLQQSSAKVFKNSSRTLTDVSLTNRNSNLVPRQVVFTLNGSPGKFHKIILRPSHIPVFTELLRELTENLHVPVYRLYTPTGRRINSVNDILNSTCNKFIACKRNERPNLPTGGDNMTKFPPINKPAETRPTRPMYKSTTNETRIRRIRSKEAVKQKTTTKLPPVSQAVTVRQTSKERAEKPTAKIPPAPKTFSKTAAGKGSGDRKNLPSPKKQRKPKTRRVKPLPKQKSETMSEDEAAAKIQAGVKGYLTRKQLKEEKTAATRIQAQYRGFRTRKAKSEGELIPDSFYERKTQYQDVRRSTESEPVEAENENYSSDFESLDSADEQVLENSFILTEDSKSTSNGASLRSGGSLKKVRKHSANNVLPPTRSQIRERYLSIARSAQMRPPEIALSASTKSPDTSGVNEDELVQPGTQGHPALSNFESQSENSSSNSKNQFHLIYDDLEYLDSDLESVISFIEDITVAAETSYQESLLLTSTRSYGRRSSNLLPPSTFDEPVSMDRKHSMDSRLSQGFKESRAEQTPNTKRAEATAKDREKAVIVIQSHARGYLTRKRLKNARNVPDDATVSVRSSTAKSERHSTPSASTKSNVGDQDREADASAVKIQAAYRGHLTRKKIKPQAQVDTVEDNVPTEAKSEPGTCLYAITTLTGNRWSADTDADLYVILHGEKTSSSPIWLRQTSDDPRLQQNQIDTFEISTQNLGILQSITVGHESKGYGAGIFLDRILVTDTEVHVYQYVFVVNRWFDSEQVDGNIERIIPVQGYYDLSSMPEQIASSGTQRGASTENKWQLVVTSGDASDAGTSANIYVVGYGSQGRSEQLLLEDAELYVPNKSSTFEADFGSVGELFKLRFLLDDSKEENTSWQLGTAQLTDLNTGERIMLHCKKWLCRKAPKGVKAGQCQLFRELPVIRLGVEPLPLITYSILLKLSGLNDGSKVSSHAQLSLTGEFGESGMVHVNLKTAAKDPDKPILLEAVSLGRLIYLNLTINVDDYGQSITEGFKVLQGVYDRQGVPEVAAKDWIVESAHVRESDHAPYRFRFSESRLHNTEEPGKIKKQLVLSDMEGLTTTRNADPVAVSGDETTWTIQVVTGDEQDAGTGSTVYIELYGKAGTSGPLPLLDSDQTLAQGSSCRYKVTSKNVGLLIKVRVRLDVRGEHPSWFLKRLIIRNDENGSEQRFMVNSWLQAGGDSNDASVELPAIWPDIPPLPVVLYQVSVFTGHASQDDLDIQSFMQLFGENGDSGKRHLEVTTDQVSPTHAPGSVETFEIEAVSLGTLSHLVLGMDRFTPEAAWFVGKVQVHEVSADITYEFYCSKWLSESKGEKKTEVVLYPEKRAN